MGVNDTCEACGRLEADNHHLKTKKSGGSDEPSNLIFLCRIHHAEIHSLGISRFILKYPNVKPILENKGWAFDEYAKKWRRLSGKQ